MCEKCKELVMCPVGEKRIVEVEYPRDDKIIDAYGKWLFINPWTMYVDKYPDGHNESGLFQEVYDENSVHYGGGLTITHCPFCGEKFA